MGTSKVLCLAALVCQTAALLTLPPEIKEGPENLTKVEGSEAVLKCRVLGAPKPIVKWMKDDVELTGGKYKITADGDLVIPSVGYPDGGTYQCSARNELGAKSAFASLEVKRRTIITDRPENKKVNAGSSATFRCNVGADDSLVLQIVWLKDGQPITDQPRFLIATDYSLLVAATTELDSGEYTCIARTPIDEARAQATLTVQGGLREIKTDAVYQSVSFGTTEDKPGTVKSLEAYPIGSSAVLLKWVKPDDENGILTGYEIYYQKVTGTFLGPLQKKFLEINPKFESAKLAGLEPNTKYRIEIKAKTRAGQGNEYYVEQSTKSVVTAKPDIPEFKASIVPSAPGTTHILVRWLPSLEGHAGTHFVAWYRLRGHPDWARSQEITDEDYVVLTGLEPGHVYELRLTAHDGDYFSTSAIQEVNVS